MQDISKYINQLVEDIQRAKVNNGSAILASYSIMGKESDFDDLPSSSHVTKPLSKIAGIEKDQLPPHSELTDQQAEFLIDQIMELLASHRIFSDFPNLLPAQKRYKLIYEYWDNDVTLKGKDHHIDFCHYSLENCPYQCYCTICDELNDD
ncbi:MAG: hypothetical protein K9H64_16310 [Bacteroidales bacterium]|nr:hypothetical protein [Bacteroidales bacterium]MCF8457532.1 hypothetical protein [Bacteroidales bacterium]